MTIVEADAILAGDSNFSQDSALVYAGSVSFGGASAFAPSGIVKIPVASTMAAGSTFSPTSTEAGAILLAILGGSSLSIDPTKVTIVNFSRGPQVPSTAKPPVIPTIRIVPPSPPQSAYSVTRNRRREDR
jgi:hypothetical protein